MLIVVRSRTFLGEGDSLLTRFAVWSTRVPPRFDFAHHSGGMTKTTRICLPARPFGGNLNLVLSLSKDGFFFLATLYEPGFSRFKVIPSCLSAFSPCIPVQRLIPRRNSSDGRFSAYDGCLGMIPRNLSKSHRVRATALPEVTLTFAAK